MGGKVEKYAKAEVVQLLLEKLEQYNTLIYDAHLLDIQVDIEVREMSIIGKYDPVPFLQIRVFEFLGRG